MSYQRTSEMQVPEISKKKIKHWVVFVNSFLLVEILGLATHFHQVVIHVDKVQVIMGVAQGLVY